MAENHYHHHNHETDSENEGHDRQQQIHSYGESNFTGHHQGVAVSSRTNEKTLEGGVQPTSSFHSVSSIDSSAEMAKYFPDAQTPTLSPFRHYQGDEINQTQSGTISTTGAPTKTSTASGDIYATVAPPTTMNQPFPQPNKAPVIVPRPQQSIRTAAVPQLPTGIPSYSSQVQGLSIGQVLVNDVIVDLQTKVINESQQQFYNDSLSGNYFEQMSPVYIRAPNPTIILRSDLHRLRAELRARPPIVNRNIGGMHPFQQNNFQAPSFPTPPH